MVTVLRSSTGTVRPSQVTNSTPFKPFTNCIRHIVCAYLYSGACTISLITDEGPRTETSHFDVIVLRSYSYYVAMLRHVKAWGRLYIRIARAWK